ncbi:MAG TPA: trigger factor [Candidatus Saccharimonadales bacterium]|nr:trigger factor [Candidatus Saccharimonadales bacterium]
MQVTKDKLAPTTFKLSITADQALLDDAKQRVLSKLGQKVKLGGFREGKAPAQLVEKNVDQAVLQSEFLEEAINRLYVAAVQEQELRPVEQPRVSVGKFVPFTTLEITVEVEAIGDIELGDYKKIKMTRQPVSVKEKDVEAVIEDLKIRAADKKEVQRAAKEGDEVWIDFTGRDAKANEPIQGADGKDYPLILGSNSFIPGFEDNLVGLKAGEDKEFSVTFPKDYGVKTLQNREVTFKVNVKKVQEVTAPKLDNAFAAKIGPFKDLAELRADIKRQLENERQFQAERALENELLEQIAEKSKADIPKSLIDEEIDRLESEERQNLAYRGQTWQEHLAEEGLDEQGHRAKNREPAEKRVKAGLILGEIAREEKIDVTSEELELQLQQLKARYKDKAMQAELDKPENIRDIASRLLTEKTLAKLKEYSLAG